LQTTGTEIAQAERRLADALTAIQACGDADPRVALTLENLVRVYLIGAQYDKAVEAAERCLQVTRDHNPQPLPLARACNTLAVVYRRAGNFDRSAAVFAEATDAAKHAGGNEAIRLAAFIQLNRGVLEADRNRWDDAERLFRFSLSVHEEHLGPHHTIVGDLANNLGVAAYHQGRYEEADSLLKRSLEIWQSALGPMNPRIALGRCNLAAVYRTQEFFTEAEWFFQRALRIWDKLGSQSLNASSEPFFSNLMDAPETGLLRPVNLLDDPLTIDLPDSMEQLQRYLREVHALRSGAETEDVKKTVEKLGPWYHNVKIHPVMTNPALGDHPASRWRILEPFVPQNLSGKSVLDIGCNAGYFSLQMKTRGASRVVGIDIMPHVLAQARFMSIWHDQPIELREMDTNDVESLGTFDYVIFVGVLYHLKHPLYALEKIAKVCTDTMFFQSVVRGPLGDFTPKDDYPNSEAAVFDLPEYPKLYFIEKSFNGDVSNWWFATQSCLTGMLRTVGFREIIPTSSADTFICRK
jgi:tRNA (mo5U34)-methyltransferase